MFIGDGGLETTMIFDEGFELPCFASFLLLREPGGVEALRRYYRGYIDIARRRGLGFTLDTPTWRANNDWGAKLGYSDDALADVNRDAVALGLQIRAETETAESPIAVCGTIGPRGDAYHPSTTMSPDEAERYHSVQIGTFAEAAADMVSAYTLAYADEAVGIVRAAAAAGVPVSIAFTVETDGRLPSGQLVGEAIEHVDADTEGAARYFMINCAHPTHVAPAIERDGPWLRRLCGVRPNASRKSHDELDRAPGLDRGDPAELAGSYDALKPALPGLRLLGGCCGTSTSHVEQICNAWLG
jgi:S-methylmethionine-dependent homocysteine/selenocysteine methylase